jgi:hypothetical protein
MYMTAEMRTRKNKERLCRIKLTQPLAVGWWGRLVAELFDLGSEGADGEGGTGLVDAFEFAVADNLSIGIVLLQ